MATTSRVVWTTLAQQDLLHILSYVADDSPRNAQRLLLRFEDLATKLSHSAMRGRVVPELGSLGVNAFRELLSKPYRLIYRVDDETSLVAVVALLDGRRALDDLLFERLVRPEA